MTLTASSEKALKTGDVAPDFGLPATDGSTFELAKLSNYEGFLVVFMCNHCPFVIAKVDELNTLQEEFGLPAGASAKAGDQIAIIGINSNDPEYMGEGMDNMKVFVKENDISFAYVLDESQDVARAYGATCTPDSFLFDAEKKLVYHGRLTDAMQPEDTPSERTMHDAITKMLAGEEVEKPFDPSLGCNVKWRA